jgi:hypothetical protein
VGIEMAGKDIAGEFFQHDSTSGCPSSVVSCQLRRT